MPELTTTKILVADDDCGTRSRLKAGFEHEGWQVLEASDSKAVLGIMRDHVVDLVMLRQYADGADISQLATTLRRIWNVPLLLVMRSGTPCDRLHALETGADDYLLDPFHMREAVLRIRRILEFHGSDVSDEACLVFDHSAFDLKNRVVRHTDGTLIELTRIELRLLELFVRHPGRVLSRDEISHVLLGRDWTPSDRSIDGHVARLRRKLALPDTDVPLIRSVRGVGYVFSGDVRVSLRQDDGTEAGAQDAEPREE
ncbi:MULTISPECIES: response regulator transcription factor [Salipiger]|uniref:Two-component system, OmpR family, phosphate regulon response regulator OmpR n=1 Tax=Salipiger profundus TaxID=1229727 RepID=A0A1U7D673_9RHOB|nr:MULTISPECIES: response regulator transcription factor [Salipiger]APX23651.1 two-component system, OmpR family, phosphate regulon response regulator OmpR [Salipiger profundus]GGA16970.1 DNA-binding response regulator [Salipiger profundus]